MSELSALDKILRETIEAISNSQEEMFAIAENARAECQRAQEDLEEIQRLTVETVDKVDASEIKDKAARRRLVEVSRNFAKYTEADIKDAYEKAKDIQIELVLLREKEKQLREKRFELELRYKNLSVMVKKAESLVSQVGVAMKFLGNNLENIWQEVQDAQDREEMVFAIIKAQEEERMRVAREIHDGPAQSMANVVMQAEYCQKLFEIDPEKVSAELEVLKNAARKNLEGIRKIIFALRPMDLDDLGLAPAVKRFLGEVEKGSHLRVKSKLLGGERRYAGALEVAVFRIIQEAINNVLKHAHANEVKVVLETQPSLIRAAVKDDGVGFEPKNDSGEEKGLGLRGMKERAALLNGSLSVSSSPGKGTEVALKIPVQEERLYGVN